MMIETLNAAGFLSEIKKLNLTGKDFLEIIGNSKVSNDIYNEIKENTGLTYSRLVELLDSSALTSEDFARLLRDAQTHAHIRVLERRKSSEQRLGQALGQAEERLEQQLKQSMKAERLLAEAKKKAEAEILHGSQKPAESAVAAAVDDDSAVPQEEAAYEPELKLDDDGLYEDIDDEDYEESESGDGVFITAADNRGKIIFCFCLAFILTAASFGLRWFYTGSFAVPREEVVIFAVPETYEELAERLINAGDFSSSREEAETVRQTLLFNNKYIFNVIENTLYIVEYNNGSMQKTAEIEYENEQIRELYFIEEKLFVITESEYENSFEHEKTIETEYGYEPEVILLADNFAQKAVTVRVYDAWSFGVQPELTFTADGEYNAVLLHRGNLVLATDYVPREPRAYSDLNAFVPAFTVNGERGFTAMSHIYVPPAALMNTEMTVLSMFSGAESVGEYVVAGGFGSVYSGEDALFISQVFGDNGGKSRLVRIDTFSENEPVFYDIDGMILPGGVSERHSILRAEVQKGENTGLYIFNNALERLSEDFIAGEEPQAAPVTEELKIEVEFDNNGNRTGIRLNVQKDEQLIAAYLITAEGNAALNPNPELFSDAEYDREAGFICLQRGIIILPVYFTNGMVDIEKVLIFNYDEAEGITPKNEIVYIYELGGGNQRRRALLADGFVYSFWDTVIVSASEFDGSVVMKLEL
jgi:hypothetical protein